MRCQHFLLIVLVCTSSGFAIASSAQQTYSLTGRLIAQNTRSWMLPAAASEPCTSFVWGSGTQGMAMTGPVNSMMFAQNGCQGGTKTITTARPIDMVGQSFTVPTGLWSIQANGLIPAIPITEFTSIVQVATSFSLHFPVADSMRLRPIGGTMSMTFDRAPWLQFKTSAWTNQTGRAGSTFTWCPGLLETGMTMVTMGIPGCGSPEQGGEPLLIKQQGGFNRVGGFGGTMAGLLYAGQTVSSFAQARPLGGYMSLALGVIEPCLGLHSKCTLASATGPFGRGYAAYLTQMAAAIDIWQTYMKTTQETDPNRQVISMASNHIGTGPGATIYSRNFPWTTGRVVVRKTGTFMGQPDPQTITAVGFDEQTSMGARNIQLVAGKLTVAVAGASALEQRYVGIAQINLEILPEPGTIAGIAGVLSLLAAATWRSRRGRKLRRPT